MCATKRGDLLILNLDDFAREVLVRPIPPWIDGDSLHIYSHHIQVCESLLDIVYVAQIIRISLRGVAIVALAADAVFDEFPGFGDANMRMNVHDHDPLAIYDDRSVLGGGCLPPG
jgi:hypothetical protein